MRGNRFTLTVAGAIGCTTMLCATWPATLQAQGTPASQGANIACSATPESAPQLPIFLLRADFHSHTAVLYLAVLGNGTDDLAARVRQVTLVPPQGLARVITAAPENVQSIRTETQEGRTISVIGIPFVRPAPGNYRVLVEDKDMSAPVRCNLSFLVVVGSLQVTTKDSH
jgi:hypothetical protein